MPFDVLTDLGFINANGRDVVTPCPDVFAPVLPGELFLCLKQLDGCFAFQEAHDFGDSVFGWYGYDHMDVIRLDVDLFDEDLIFLTAEAILRTEYNAIGTQPDTV